jgi:Peptidase family C25.
MNQKMTYIKLRHLKKVIFTGFLFLVITTPALMAQQEYIKGEIKWGKPKEIVDPASGNPISVLNFDLAVYNNTETHLPVYQNQVKLGSDVEYATIKFGNIYFEELTSEESKLIENSKDIPDSLIINTTIGHERKQAVLIYSFIPLRKNKQTGKIEKIRIFTLSLSKTRSSNLLKSTSATSRYADNSVLSTGDWYKFYIRKSGVYQISYNELKNMGISNPADVRIYGNGGKVLPEVYSGKTEDDLQEIPIMMETGTDGKFNDGDYILFYAEGPVTWTYDYTKKTYSHHKHPFIGVPPYGDEGRVPYFITALPGGARIQTDTTTYTNVTTEVNSYDGLAWHERNLTNPLMSGQSWYGENFADQASMDFTFSFPDLISSEPLSLEALVLGRSGLTNYFSFKQNNNSLGSIGISPVSIINSLSYYGRLVTYKSTFASSSNNLTLNVSYNNGGDANGSGWLGYMRLVARENLNLSSSQISFRDSRSVKSSASAKFSITNATKNTVVMDVTNINHPVQMNGSFQNNTYSYNANTDVLHEFVAFNSNSELLHPEFISDNNGKVPNQNLHGLKYSDLLIVSPPAFLSEAQRLADLHSQKEGISYTIVTPDQVYNEFSSGKQDPAAIRNFVKMFYDRASSTADVPKYLLLFGDGTYDNRCPFPSYAQNTNYIVTYESINTLDPTSTFVSDDYFGLLDDYETIVTGPLSNSPYTYALLDIGIGRIPVDTLEQAKAVVDKIEKYMNTKNHGDWRNTLCFIADDQENNAFMISAEDIITNSIAPKYPAFNIEKIYLDAYPRVSTSTGNRYPEVNKAINNQLNKGLLILNYVGHGGESGLADEQIMTQTGDIKQWKNDNYPLFITATCDFARFDRISGGTTAGEDVLLNPNGGGIALLTTNRLVYNNYNVALTEQFYNIAFIKTEDNRKPRLGDIIKKAKNKTGSDINKLNFALIGDPALCLAYPEYSVVTDSINGKPLNITDTLKAYSLATIKGHIQDENGNLSNGFNGFVIPSLFDKIQDITTLANDPSATPFNFQLQDNVLFRGKTSVKNGEFTTQFMLPRDINYNFGNGRLSYYASDSTSEASGYYNGVVVGGIETSVNPDTVGPKIKLYMNDTTFLDGGITDAFPTLLARVYDNNGINPGGNGLGHDITAILDDNPDQTYVLNSYFQSDIDNYKQGSVSYKFSQLSPGKHTLTFKVWNIFNNSSKARINFEVVNQNSPSIQRVYNYPNPFSNDTYFFFEHNQNYDNLDVTIEIFGFSGNKVCELKTTLSEGGFTSGPIRWDGRDSNGNKISSGIYIYRVILRSIQGSVISRAQKMVFIKQ